MEDIIKDASETGNSNVPEETPEYDFEDENPPKKSHRWLTWTIALLLVGVGIFATIYFLNRNGNNEKVSITPQFIQNIHDYQQVDGYYEGLAAARKGDKWGYINVKGEEAIPFQYTTHPGRFSEGLACVESPGKGIHFIDKEGNTVITGDFFLTNMMGTASLHTTESLMPYFENGICVLQDPNPDTDYKDIAINTKGEKVAVPQSYDPNAQLTPKEPVNENGFKRFEEQTADGVKYGYKDSTGKVVIPAAYNELGPFNNGVALAAISYSGPYIESDDPGMPMDYFAVWGYVDEKGNSTFTDADFARIKNVMEKSKLAEDEAIREMERQEAEYKKMDEIKQWIQGTWELSLYGITSTLSINGDMLSVSSDGRLEYEGSYSLRKKDGAESPLEMEICYPMGNGATGVIDLDQNNRRLMAGVTPYVRRSSDTYSSSNHNGSSIDDSEEMRLMGQLHKLNEEGKSLINKLQRMRDSGRWDPMEYMWIKQRCLAIKDRQMSIARQLKDPELERQYMAQKRTVEQMFRSLEH